MNDGTMTLEKLKAMMAYVSWLPPAPIFGMSIGFPADRPIMFKIGNQQYVGAHPDFWERVTEQLPKRDGPPLLGEIEIINLDLSRNYDKLIHFMSAMRKAAE